MFFIHSRSDDLQTGPMSWLWCMLFGPFYFLMKGKWRHAAVSLALTIVAGALSSWLYGLIAAWLLYPLLVEGINASTHARESVSVASAAGDDESLDPDDIDAMIARQKARQAREQAERREAEKPVSFGRSQTTAEPQGFGKRRTPPPSIA